LSREAPLLVLACRDLFFASRIETVARKLGWGAERLPDRPPRNSAEQPNLAIVDLDGGDDPIAWVRELRRGGEELTIVAFVRHDEAERIRAAREAGASQVLSRGAFTQKLPGLLERAVGDTMSP
jgi:DNA-binding NarL/FixJ family response regulator